MNEKDIEKRLIRETKSMGGLCMKFISPGLNGVPDRLVLLPGGYMGFVEVKAPGGKLRPLQVRRMNQIVKLGFKTFCVSTPEMIGAALYEIRKA